MENENEDRKKRFITITAESLLQLVDEINNFDDYGSRLVYFGEDRSNNKVAWIAVFDQAYQIVMTPDMFTFVEEESSSDLLPKGYRNTSSA